MSETKLFGKSALVTGASRGIGRAIARKLAAAGATVAVHYHTDHSAAEDSLAALPGTGHILVQADVADPEQTERMVVAACDRLGGLDILVNNAGVWLEHAPAEVDYETWRRVWRETIDLNLLGAANAAYCAGRHMLECGGGCIINVGSRGAYRGEPTAPAYGAAKAGMHAMSQSLAVAFGPHGIRVTAVAPGWVETDMTREALHSARGKAVLEQSPLGRVATVDEIASVVLFLAEPGSEWVTGGVIDVNGASYLR
jgi:3-oxoacyl-[acyl-carrier protein] reductase